MLQNFKRHYYQFVTDPALVPMLPFFLLCFLGSLMQSLTLWLPSFLILLVLAFWQKFCRVDIGRNFQALPALPGGYHTIGQRVPKGINQEICRELRLSLIKDGRDAIASIPAGKYQALTHETVLRRLEQSARISVESATPAYMATLQSVLMAQTHKRCRNCKARCSIWNAQKRQFYLVRFHVL